MILVSACSLRRRTMCQIGTLSGTCIAFSSTVQHSLLVFLQNLKQIYIECTPAPGAPLKGVQAYLSRWGLAQPQPARYTSDSGV